MKSLSEMPALCMLSTKWLSLLPTLIPHSVIRAHLVRQFLNKVSLVMQQLRVAAGVDTHLAHATTSDRPHVSSWKPAKPVCLCAFSSPGKSERERRPLSCVKLQALNPPLGFKHIRSMRPKLSLISHSLPTVPLLRYICLDELLQGCAALFCLARACTMRTHMQHSR